MLVIFNVFSPFFYIYRYHILNLKVLAVKFTL